MFINGGGLGGGKGDKEIFPFALQPTYINIDYSYMWFAPF